MSIKVMSAVFDAGGLRPAQKSVLLALADHANEDGNSIYPSVNRVVIKTGLSERAVRKALSELRNENLLIVVRESTQHFPTEYAINLRKLQSLKHPDLQEMHPKGSDRPAPDAPLDTPDLHQVPSRPAPDAPKSSVNPKDDAEKDKAINAGKPAATPLTAGQKHFLEAFDAKRFSRTIQAKTILNLEQIYGTEKLNEYADWAAKKGMRMGDAVSNAETTLPKWGKPKGNPNGKQPQPDQSSDEWQAEYERTKIEEQARVKKLFEDHKRKLAEGAKSGNPD